MQDYSVQIFLLYKPLLNYLYHAMILFNPARVSL